MQATETKTLSTLATEFREFQERVGKKSREEIAAATKEYGDILARRINGAGKSNDLNRLHELMRTMGIGQDELGVDCAALLDFKSKESQIVPESVLAEMAEQSRKAAERIKSAEAELEAAKAGKAIIDERWHKEKRNAENRADMRLIRDNNPRAFGVVQSESE